MVKALAFWAGSEEEAFNKVLADFTAKTGWGVKYEAYRQTYSTTLQSRITGGNPLALTELAPQLSPAQRRGSAVLPPTLLLGERLTLGFEHSLIPLSAAGRQALLLAVVSIDGQAGPICAALEQQGLDPAGTAGELEQAGVIQLSDGHYTFRHPLFRAITIQLAAPSARRAAVRTRGPPPGHPCGRWPSRRSRRRSTR